MPMKTATLNDFTQTYRRVMAYGAPGAGKTHFIQYLPRPFVFSFDEGGLETLARLPADVRTDLDIQFMPRPEMPPLTFEQVMLIMAQIAARPAEFGETLVLDTLTQLERQLLATEAERQKRPLGIPAQEDYRPGQQRIMQLVTTALKLPMHLYITCGEGKVVEARSGGVIAIEPDLTPRLIKDIPRMLGEIYYFKDLGNKNYACYTQSDGVAYAKSRMALPTNLSAKRLAERLFAPPEMTPASLGLTRDEADRMVRDNEEGAR